MEDLKGDLIEFFEKEVRRIKENTEIVLSKEDCEMILKALKNLED